jgi:hypothetical protein
MSDETKSEESQEPIMIDMPKLKLKNAEPRPPVYEVQTFTDLKTKEVLQFTQKSLKGGVVTPPLQMFRGRTFVMYRPHPNAQPVQQAIVFDFPTEKTLEECFDNFDARREEHLDKMNRDAEAQQRIIAAKGMPQMRMPNQR